MTEYMLNRHLTEIKNHCTKCVEQNCETCPLSSLSDDPGTEIYRYCKSCTKDCNKYCDLFGFARIYEILEDGRRKSQVRKLWKEEQKEKNKQARAKRRSKHDKAITKQWQNSQRKAIRLFCKEACVVATSIYTCSNCPLSTISKNPIHSIKRFCKQRCQVTCDSKCPFYVFRG